MKHVQIIGAIFAAWLVFCGCTKPGHIHAGGQIDETGPFVKEVRLADTISLAFSKSLHLDNITGSSFEYPSGQRSSYFSYRASPDRVLDALARLSFPLHGHFSDVAYHALSAEEWYALRDSVGEYERMDQSHFWDADPALFYIVASMKNDDHLLLIERNGNHIKHRVSSPA